MFTRKPRDPEIETLIGPGTRVDGDLRVTGGVHVAGRVHGNVTVAEASGAAVIEVAESGVVEGNVDVPRVVVHGEVRGDVRASEKIELGPKARVAGSVIYGVIEMAAGAVIQGRLVSTVLASQAAAGAAGEGGTAAPVVAASGEAERPR
jgi:cytoskeletal protein CcmA (bactofilin family)